MERYEIHLDSGILKTVGNNYYKGKGLEEFIEELEKAHYYNRILKATDKSVRHKNGNMTEYVFIKEQRNMLNRQIIEKNCIKLYIEEQNYDATNPAIVRLNNLTKGVKNLNFKNGVKKIFNGIAIALVTTSIFVGGALLCIENDKESSNEYNEDKRMEDYYQENTYDYMIQDENGNYVFPYLEQNINEEKANTK